MEDVIKGHNRTELLGKEVRINTIENIIYIRDDTASIVVWGNSERGGTTWFQPTSKLKERLMQESFKVSCSFYITDTYIDLLEANWDMAIQALTIKHPIDGGR